MLSNISKRLAALEATVRTTGLRYFTGYEATGLYYEGGIQPVNYRTGLCQPEEGPAYTEAAIANLKRQGWDISSIVIRIQEGGIGAK